MVIVVNSQPGERYYCCLCALPFTPAVNQERASGGFRGRLAGTLKGGCSHIHSHSHSPSNAGRIEQLNTAWKEHGNKLATEVEDVSRKGKRYGVIIYRNNNSAVQWPG